MIVSLEEMKQYLRVDFDEDDVLLEHLIFASENLCMDIARIDDIEKFAEEKNARIAVMYAVAYQYEHREDADHHALVLSLRALLFGIRQEGF
ncbi:MAG: head-tail connector protein [Hespellia sp.]|nr:head-tail connector protein [Hespellia sp.]